MVSMEFCCSRCRSEFFVTVFIIKEQETETMTLR